MEVTNEGTRMLIGYSHRVKKEECAVPINVVIDGIIFASGEAIFQHKFKEGIEVMRKLYSLGMSFLMLFGMGTAAMAFNLETSGEFISSYNWHHWTGENDSYAWVESSIKNHISISEVVSGDINLWYGTAINRDFEIEDWSDVKNKLVDAAYLTFKLGPNSLKVGCDFYPQDGSLNVLGDFTKGLVGDLKPAAVHILGTMPINNFKVEAGYFHNVGGDFFNMGGDEGRNNVVMKSSYAAGKFNADLTYLLIGKGKWDTVDPAAEYILDAGYKISDKYKVYAAYVGANRTERFDNNKSTTNWQNHREDQTDNFAILGCSASLGKLWLAAEYTVLTPSKEDNYEWVKYTDTTGKAHNWADNPPFGVKLSYWFGHNTTLEYIRVANTGNSNDKDRLSLKVKF